MHFGLAMRRGNNSPKHVASLLLMTFLLFVIPGCCCCCCCCCGCGCGCGCACCCGYCGCCYCCCCCRCGCGCCCCCCCCCGCHLIAVIDNLLVILAPACMINVHMQQILFEDLSVTTWQKNKKKRAFLEIILFRMHIETSKDRGTRPTKSTYLPSLKLTVRPGKEPIPKGNDGVPTIDF